MFHQLKAAFKKAKETDAVSEAVQRKPVIESKPSVPERTAAERSLIAELSGLSLAGANASTNTPVVSGTSPTQAEPIAVTPAEPQSSPVEQKVVAFIKLCHLTSGLTYREIASGCDLQIADVKVALASLVASGTLSHSDEAEPNYRRYMLTTSEPVKAAPPADPYGSPEARWAAEARQRHQAEQAARHPQPIVRSTVPPLDEIVLPEPAKPLTPEERRLHDSLIPKNRVSRNPQEYVKR
jgi:hypothetical protein